MLLVVRDGRSVIRSTQTIMEENVPLHRIGGRALQTPLWEWPAYVPRAVSVLARKVTRRPLNYWGPRPPDWSDWVNNDPTEVVLAKQWTATIRRAIEGAESIGTDSCYVFKYEQLMSDPKRIMTEIVDFCGLETANNIVDKVVATADPARQAKWRRSLDTATLDMIRPHMEPMLCRLGYAW